MQIKIAARESNLSKVQVEEIYHELLALGADVTFTKTFVKTTGDLDQKTSLADMDKTNFFTKEVDELVLSGNSDVGIHAAKDLPEPLPKGLEVFAITKGKDPRDSLILREEETLQSLGENPRVGTSSKRREKMIKDLINGALLVDIRGTIEKRLQLLEDGAVDALVIAEVALIRLNLTHLNRVFLEGETAAYQGQIAVVGKEKNVELKRVFKGLNEQKGL
ncbi:hydroxymethylbilane synthase [Candidatus Aerophobetes bacterium]|uniref:Hydroxymethylbilane synthase n=1 Tax=Aerophobetes bacterium TaxID=2030807 RepID=A0A2A4YKU4_UNCAE|nr:MAG: hydroxymethylbilane synthase [Candidatus Aerophobetes bacterium]